MFDPTDSIDYDLSERLEEILSRFSERLADGTPELDPISPLDAADEAVALAA